MSNLLFTPSKRDRRVTVIDCQKLFEGDPDETHKAYMTMARSPRKPIPDGVFTELSKNCSEFVSERGYIMEPTSDEEANFPIAFSILMYKEAEQAERFLRSIYQPQNTYCIHVDLDSPEDLHTAIEGLVSCLPNVFIASKLESIVYGGFSRLQADINCMLDLSRRNVSWKYFINQPSQAFPLRTNAELVKILKIYNGSNDIEGISVEKVPHMKNRFLYHHAFRYPDGARKPIVVRTARRKRKPPQGLNITKGSAYGVFSRDFVDFILNDQLSQSFLKWCKDTYSPDEHYWSTLHHTMYNSGLHTPGGFSGVPDKKPWLATYAAWGGKDPCHGQFRHGVCIFGIQDLPNLTERKEFFANKFYLTHQPLALDCLEEYMYNRTIHRQPIDTSYYETLPFVIKGGL